MLFRNKLLKWKWHNFLITILLFAFYIILYFTDIFNKPAQILGLTDKWFFYGFLYTIAILLGGIRFIRQHHSERYQLIRTSFIMFIQLIIAFIIPYMMRVAEKAEYYFSYFWPLKIEYFYPSTIIKFPMVIIFYSLLGSLIAFPILAYFFGKRFYCSWLCGCGGLANTAGDAYRHYSSKTLKSWKFERFSIYSVLMIAILTTVVVFINTFTKSESVSLKTVAAFFVKWYAYIISFGFAGLIGIGLYPLFGTRVWCRFFCPMAAMLGLFQKMGRFRITSQKDTCISCGNCSKYCEMGINVRSYAQRSLPVKRAGCVGCGMCAHVCPRGVLRLENKK